MCIALQSEEDQDGDKKCICCCLTVVGGDQFFYSDWVAIIIVIDDVVGIVGVQAIGAIDVVIDFYKLPLDNDMCSPSQSDKGPDGKEKCNCC